MTGFVSCVVAIGMTCSQSWYRTVTKSRDVDMGDPQQPRAILQSGRNVLESSEPQSVRGMISLEVIFERLWSATSAYCQSSGVVYTETGVMCSAN